MEAIKAIRKEVTMDGVHGKIISALSAFTLAVFMPVVELIFFTGVLIIVDTITGIWASVKEEGWKAFRSERGLQGMIPKLLIYPAIIIIASGAQYFYPDIPLAKVAAGILIFWEGKSIVENSERILGIGLIRLFKVYVKDGKKGLLKELKK